MQRVYEENEWGKVSKRIIKLTKCKFNHTTVKQTQGFLGFMNFYK